jgi:hypothetical protein
MPRLSRENLEKQPMPEKEEATFLFEKELIEEFIKESDTTKEEWLKENVEDFGENFRDTINENPDLLNLYKRDPEKAKQEFRKLSTIH